MRDAAVSVNFNFVMSKSPPSTPRPIQNRKAGYNFEILEKVETGISLLGTEVKSLRAGRASIEESYALIRDGEVYLRDCNIQPYANATVNAHHPTRERKLLLHRRQILKLLGKVTQKGLTLVPLKLFFNERGLVKVDLGLVRGKKTADKRDSIKKRDQQRDMDRETRRRR